MNLTNLKSLIESAAPVSPDRAYALTWTWGGRIGIVNLAEGEPLLSFREERGAIMRAGFSPDMRQLVAENEDRSVSIWYVAASALGEKLKSAGNIVEFMTANDLVPCLNIRPGLRACRFDLSLRDFSEAQYNFYDWDNFYCDLCAWYRPGRASGGRPPQTCCSLPDGCDFKRK